MTTKFSEKPILLPSQFQGLQPTIEALQREILQPIEDLGLVSNPPSGMHKITNIYYDPVDEEVKYVIDDTPEP